LEEKGIPLNIYGDMYKGVPFLENLPGSLI